MLLYASTDEGRKWELAANIAPDKNIFPFFAGKDGKHWLRVAVVNKAGVQEPDDKTLMSSPLDKFETIQIVIDTLKPIIRTINGQRVGDEVCINWDIQEDFPDRAGIRLEYLPKNSPTSSWTAVPVSFVPIGQARFRPTTNQTIVVRLTVRDLAGNQSFRHRGNCRHGRGAQLRTAGKSEHHCHESDAANTVPGTNVAGRTPGAGELQGKNPESPCFPAISGCSAKLSIPVVSK